MNVTDASLQGSAPPALESLVQSQRAISPFLHRTPVIRSSSISRICGVNVFIKAELFQKTGSFKPRGMLWALLQLDEAQRARGVITFSSGNAGQALGYAAAALGIAATVVMPEGASTIKVAATKGYGAEVILHGAVQDCAALCARLVADRGLTFVPAYDDDDVMRGHASLGLEVFEDVPNAAAIYIPVGGGGLAGGVALAANALNHSARLFGVEPAGAAAMQQSLAAGAPVSLANVVGIADGLGAPAAGKACFAILKSALAGLVVVQDDQIVEAMKHLAVRTKLYAEPSGAAALAGLLVNAGAHRAGDDVVVIVSGGNMDPARLAALFG